MFCPVHLDHSAPRDLQGEHSPLSVAGYHRPRAPVQAGLLLQLTDRARDYILAWLT
jgi:hypothetical protein